MSASPADDVGPDVPVFSECIVGYCAWRADDYDQLWPLWDDRRPWTPGVNTARCNCGTTTSLRFQWNLYDGRRVLEPAPEHEAPAAGCECGLYSWRRPKSDWASDPDWHAWPWVVGAVACWGHVQVHHTGFRAEHACVVTLSHFPDVEPDVLEDLVYIARRHRVDLVPYDELEVAASRHGTPLPDAVGPLEDPRHDPDEPPPAPVDPAPDATPEQVVLPRRVYKYVPWGLLPPEFPGF